MRPHAEVALLPSSTARQSDLQEHVVGLVRSQPRLYEGQELDFRGSPTLARHVERIRLCDVPAENALEGLVVNVHRLYDDEAAEEGVDGVEGESVAFNLWLLPSREFDAVWGSLLYEEGIKEKLLQYVRTAMRFSEMNVDPSLISWNRVVLLHGPPGTGKS